MKLYNTLNRKVEDFIPREEGKVTMYTCGPTVYNFAHIGNLRTYIFEDILEKALKYVGFDVKRVMNITDVGHLESDADEGEDKMLKGAKRENKTVLEIAEMYTEKFFEDCARLNITKPDLVKKATDHIEEYIEMIKVLEEKGYTYFTNGNVYFDISKFPEYTKLSKMNLDELQTASRDDVEEDENKRNPQDFVLWFTKSKFENQALKWDSPWGVGYPGWHIECSAISLKYLGEYLDIHCGGVDHIAVHHTNEIAQSEAYIGHEWTKYWLHGEHLNDKTGKMSKSKGEFMTLSLIESKGYDPLVYRYFVLNSHYRKQLVFSYENLDMAKNAFEKLKNRILEIKANEQDDKVSNEERVQKYQEMFKVNLENDLNTANALTVIHELVKDEEVSNQEKVKLIEEFDKVLGLDFLEEEEVEISDEEVRTIEELIEKRNIAKKEKRYDDADKVREELKSMGIEIKDTREGTMWNKIR